MKTLIIAIGILMSGNAHAVVKAVGTFVPKECSTPRHLGSMPLVGVGEICVGRMIVNRDQATKPAIRFQLTTGQYETFLVTQSKSLGVAPGESNGRSQYNRLVLELRSREGKRAVVRVLQTVDGRTHFLSGQLGVVKFEARDFESVYSVAGITDRR